MVEAEAEAEAGAKKQKKQQGGTISLIKGDAKK